MRQVWRQRVRPRLDELEWLLVVGIALTAFALGFIGFERQPDETGEPRSTLDNLYRSLQLFWLEYGSSSEPTSGSLDAARLLAPLVLGYAAVRALWAIFREQFRLLRFTRKKRVVICGLGRMGWLLARSFRERGYWVAVIEQDANNSRIKACRELGMPVVVGDATDPSRLRTARVRRAACLIAVCGSDGTNASVAAHAQKLVAQRRESRDPLTVFAHVVDLELCRLLRNRMADEDRTDSFRLELFNVFESGARAWLGQHLPMNDRHERPHLVVVGVGQMGMSLVLGAARNWLTVHRGDSAPRITVVDREAHRRRDSLAVNYPQLERLCELVAVQLDVTWAEFEWASFLFDDEGRCDVTTIYVCLDDDPRGVAAALTLLERVREHGVPIIVRTAERAGLAALLEEEGERADGFELLQTFPLLDRTCIAELLLGESFDESLARAIHDAYLRHERESGKTPEDNPALVDWTDLPESLKESNRRQADHITVKLKEVGCGSAPLTEADADRFAFSDEEVEQLARMEHERWLGERLFEGWTYAPQPKDLRRKTSPALVGWDELTEEERDKDRSAVRELPALLAAAGFRAYRRQSSR